MGNGHCAAGGWIIQYGSVVLEQGQFATSAISYQSELFGRQLRRDRPRLCWETVKIYFYENGDMRQPTFNKVKMVISLHLGDILG